MKLADFDYTLPPRQIAQFPAAERDQARLMVLNRKSGSLEHRLFSDLPDYLRSGDVLVVNETKVLPARLMGRKESGGKIEVLLVRPGKGSQIRSSTPDSPGEEHREWECLAQTKGRLHPGTIVFLDEGLHGEFLGRSDEGLWRVCLKGRENIDQSWQRIGFAPLPPYIRRNGQLKMKFQDLERYQTVFARQEGAIAAPTAGLHFTEALLEKIRRHKVEILPITLHVGIGTFLPVKTEDLENHRLAREFFEVPLETARAVNQARGSGRRILAVGTTVSRTLESCVDDQGEIRATKGETGLFIFPGYKFRMIDALITNFHLPRSTLLMLVSAFAGREFILTAYEEAIRSHYRFYSYGDAMLIL